MTKVSIIMPVYNAGEFLEQTFKSIMCQTLKDIEVICVDDGSTDNSSKVLKRLEKQYDFIKVYTTENQGSGKARNEGIKKATGEYIAFLDADDSYIDENALEKMYVYGHHNNANIVCANLLRITKDRTVEEDYEPESVRFKYFRQKKTLEPDEYGIPWAFYKNIFKTSFLRENNIEFPDLIRGQDPIFMTRALTGTEKIHVINIDLYGYNHSINGGVNLKLNTYEKKQAYIQHFKDTMDLLEQAGFETPLNEYKKEFINYVKFKNNLYDDDIRQIISGIFADKKKYFTGEDDLFFLDLLENSEVDAELEEYEAIKKCLFEETLTSENFIDYSTLKKYTQYRSDLEDKFSENEIRKAAYNSLKQVEKEVTIESEEIGKLEDEIKAQNEAGVLSKMWKIMKLMNKIRKNRKEYLKRI